MEAYSPEELMVIEAARYIEDQEVRQFVAILC